MTTRCVFGALGTCSVLAVLVAQPVQAADQGFYFKADAGVALVQDIGVNGYKGNSLPASFISDGTKELLGYTIPAGSITINKPKFEMDPGARVDFIGGYNFCQNFALELEVGAVYNSFKDVTFSGSRNNVPVSYSEKLDANLWQVPVLVNAVYTFKLDSKFKPYIGAGAGGILTYIDGNNTSENDFTFAYQAMAGVRYELSSAMDIGLSYKFLGSLDHKFGDVKTDGIYTHSILAEFVVRF